MRIGDVVYELDVVCYAPGAGEVLAIGAGLTAAGDQVEAYVQAYVGEPYVGVRIGDGPGSLVEASLGRSLDFYIQDDVIRVSAIRFVRGLDLESGEGESVGFGELEIRCNGYEADPPL
ncbi:MAG: hypothetical protein ACE5GB_07580 [Acidimicrobiales bacterium]